MTRYFLTVLTALTLALFMTACETEVGETTPGVPRDVDSSLVVGRPAPSLGEITPIRVSEGLDLDLEAMKGEVVVLEFWATWCAPCLQAMPHLNELITHFEGRPIRFLALTYESPEKARPTLERVPMLAEVASITDEVFQNVYQARTIPMTVIIDADGNIAKVTRPLDLNEAYLEPFVKQAEARESSVEAAVID